VVLPPQDPLCRRSDLDSALDCDHRLIDGAVADQFAAFVKKTLEGWSEDAG
jgi:pyruvate/2-oxoglutarate dehydrogenase complex dihydrolipoamide acyltransferase (E2) component